MRKCDLDAARVTMEISAEEKRLSEGEIEKKRRRKEETGRQIGEWRKNTCCK